MFHHLQQYMNPNQIQAKTEDWYYWHYSKYLSQLTFQLFEWENLPETIDPRYLEMMLHTHGYVGFYKDPVNDRFVVSNGAAGRQLNRYLQPTKFETAIPDVRENYENVSFDIINYGDDIELMKKESETYGMVIWNNDLHIPTMDSVILYAKKLAHVQGIIDVNLNAQKTPVLIGATDTNKLSMRNIYNQYEGNAPVIMADKSFDPKTIQVFKTDAPFVCDKLNDQKNAYKSEFLTYLGINNTSIDKKERLVSAEATSNNQEIKNSNNIMLKSRKEFVERAKFVYPNELEGLEVRMRDDVIDTWLVDPNMSFGGGEDSTVYN